MTLARTVEAKRLLATLAGGAAVLLWALLALFTTWADGIPPFQLAFLCFSLGTAVGLVALLLKGRAAWHCLQQPWQAWMLGVSGLFGCHVFYFLALGNAPAVEASLLTYLWPLLTLLFSALLPGERLRWFHLLSVLLGLTGAGFLVTKGQGFNFDDCFALGYMAALACALTWALYSVMNRRFGGVPTQTVTGFCAGAALLGLVCHLLFESWVPPNRCQWGAVLLLGLGPVGLAFFVWDFGTKHGDIQALAAFAYSAPLLSTVTLIAVGQGEAGWHVALACALIISGAVLGSLNLLRRRRV
ncbi:aromatic amino acid exporter YddG [Algihabitans albus]|uniref:aromatic amino acid exporter YddG n=1 Tax=Algihabitans albus TaxID=2164067 RepID=UPI000E5DA47C|nr:DMT family transporter [Algihabitans albus]